MSSLINTKIQDTYTGLIKTADNTPITATLKNLEDGNGGVLPIQVSTTGVNFTGNVTGITAGGLAEGTGTDSIASVLTATPATSKGIASSAVRNARKTKVVVLARKPTRGMKAYLRPFQSTLPNAVTYPRIFLGTFVIRLSEIVLMIPFSLSPMPSKVDRPAF